MYSIAEVNALDAPTFVSVFGSVYEHSPWVAATAAAQRPFADAQALAAAMQAAVNAATREAQLILIRAHPELLGRLAPSEAAAIALTAESRSEQSSVGLDRCTQEELDLLRALNQAYREKFDFPFIVAVRGLSRSEIIARLSARLENNAEAEFQNNLGEILKIAVLRLAALVTLMN
jgi:2-oxo-4-hydroxy-4-carboxy-5-ureidoimidazoline decarboxylase